MDEGTREETARTEVREAQQESRRGSAALRLHVTREAAAAEGALRGGEAARFWAYMFPAHGGKIFCFEY